MSIEHQNTLNVSQETINYGPDAEVIHGLQNGGHFVVVSKSLAYCPFTDASLPNPITRLAKDVDGKPLVFQTEEGARMRIQQIFAEDPDLEDVSFDVKGPSFVTKHWQNAVSEFVSENVNLDPDDARKWCARNAQALMTMHAQMIPPAVAAAEFCKANEHFDYAAWETEHRPELPQPQDFPELDIPF